MGVYANMIAFLNRYPLMTLTTLQSAPPSLPRIYSPPPFPPPFPPPPPPTDERICSPPFMVLNQECGPDTLEQIGKHGITFPFSKSFYPPSGLWPRTVCPAGPKAEGILFNTGWCCRVGPATLCAGPELCASIRSAVGRPGALWVGPGL